MSEAKPLDRYQAKRDFAATPEPSGEEHVGATDAPRFVVQEHHARRLHWDFRLERGGVLVSWAVPKGVPPDPRTNHLAVPTEDHPMSYLDFEGEIPQGNYGAGQVIVWDRGTYECHKWEPDEVLVTLHGERVHGRYVLFKTRPDSWMIHRMDPPEEAGWEPLPDTIEPMTAVAGKLPADDRAWAFEIRWPGVRAIAFVDGGRLRLDAGDEQDLDRRFPEVARAGGAFGARPVALDGVLTVLDEAGRPDPELLAARLAPGSDSTVRRRARDHPATYVAFDVLHLDGHATTDLAYEERRRLLTELLGAVDAAPAVHAPSHHVGDGAALLDVARGQGLAGVIAKRLDSSYESGRASDAWISIDSGT
jgi:bifunctional non-homologous end joining protein LigD